MALASVLLIVLVLMLVGALPAWPHARHWGWRPFGGIGVVLVVVLVLSMMGRL